VKACWRAGKIVARRARGLANRVENGKNVKIVGTNSVKSFRINKSVKKTNSKRTGFSCKKRSFERKKRPKIRDFEAGKMEGGDAAPAGAK
jgi:hypothetical protein